MSFVIFSLPRSRSTWLSVFLSHGGFLIGHDIGTDCERPEDFFRLLGDGTCETGAAFAWRAIRAMQPDLKFAVVFRDPHEVAASLALHGFPGQLVEMQVRHDFLHDIASLPGTLAVDYYDLQSSSVCAELFKFCLGYALDIEWWRRFDGLNIQVDMAKQVAKLIRNRVVVENLKADVRNMAVL